MMETMCSESFRVPTEVNLITVMHNQVQEYITKQKEATDKAKFVRETGPIHLAAWAGILKACITFYETQQDQGATLGELNQYMTACNQAPVFDTAREVRMCKKSKTHTKEMTKLTLEVKRPAIEGQEPDHWGAFQIVVKTLMNHCRAIYNYGEAPRGSQERILQQFLN